MRYVFTILLLLFCGNAAAGEDDAKGTTGLPLPRFAILRANEVNLRTGPGTRYPIDWVYKRADLPVEITAEYDIWRRVRDWEGSEGWVQKNALAGKRGVIVIGERRELRESANVQSAVRAHLEPGVVGKLLSCSLTWCRVKFEGAKGYLQKTEFWGAYADEVFE